jgi:spermidine dehydrogenase
VRSLGIDLRKFESEYYDHGWRSQARSRAGLLLRARTFGTERLVRASGRAADWVPSTPLPARAQRELIELIDAPRDYLPGLDRAGKRQRLAAITYREFLLDTVRTDPKLVDFFSTSTVGYFGVGIDATSALDACANGNPGFAALDPRRRRGSRDEPIGTSRVHRSGRLHLSLSDGNYGLRAGAGARPDSARAAGSSDEELVTARVDYPNLDAGRFAHPPAPAGDRRASETSWRHRLRRAHRRRLWCVRDGSSRSRPGTSCSPAGIA